MDAIGNKKEWIGNIAFWAGIFCELTVSFSGYLYGGYREPLIIIAGMGFFCLSILFTAEWKKDWWKFVLAGAFGLLCYCFQNSALVLRVLLALLAGRKQDAKQVVKVFFFGTAVVMGVTAILSALGLHNSLYVVGLFRNVEEVRFCFGFYHPNGYSFFILRLMIMACYVYGDKWNRISAVILAILGAVAVILSSSKMGIAAYILLVAGTALVRWKKEKSVSLLAIPGAVLMALEIAFIYFVMVFFKPSGEWREGEGLWNVINSLMTGRAYLAHETFRSAKIPLLGYSGFEGGTEVGFVNLLYQQGLICVLLYLVCLFYIYYRRVKQKDALGMVLILVFTFYAMAEAFLPYFNKNGVWFMAIGLLYETQTKRVDEYEEDQD